MRKPTPTAFPAAALAIAATALLALPVPAASVITLFPQTTVQAILTGPGSTAEGECIGLLTPGTGDLDLTCTSNVAGAGAVLLTVGHPEDGIDLVQLGTGAVVGVELTLTEPQVAELLTGQLWVAATSPGRPRGEVVARLLPRPPVGQAVMRFPLRNDEMVQTGSTASGSCAIGANANHSSVKILCTHTVDNAQQMRIHLDGGPVATISDVDSPFEATVPVFANDYQRLLDGDFGVILTSQRFPNGELGTVLSRCVEGPNTLCLNDGRFRVTIGFTRPGNPPAAARTVGARSDDAGLFWFFNPSNWEVQLKVLDACTLNQRFWVFISANTNVAYTATVYDTATGQARTYSNPQGQIAEPVADTSALPCT